MSDSFGYVDSEKDLPFELKRGFEETLFVSNPFSGGICDFSASKSASLPKPYESMKGVMVERGTAWATNNEVLVIKHTGAPSRISTLVPIAVAKVLAKEKKSIDEHVKAELCWNRCCDAEAFKFEDGSCFWWESCHATFGVPEGWLDRSAFSNVTSRGEHWIKTVLEAMKKTPKVVFFTDSGVVFDNLDNDRVYSSNPLWSKGAFDGHSFKKLLKFLAKQKNNVYFELSPTNSYAQFKVGDCEVYGYLSLLNT